MKQPGLSPSYKKKTAEVCAEERLPLVKQLEGQFGQRLYHSPRISLQKGSVAYLGAQLRRSCEPQSQASGPVVTNLRLSKAPFGGSEGEQRGIYKRKELMVIFCWAPE